MKYLLTLLLISMVQVTMAQGFGIKAYGNYGVFESASDKFKNMYGQPEILGVEALIGEGTVFLFAKYRELSASGTSKTNLPVDGVANWDQQFYQVGLRAYETAFKNLGVFGELGYVRSEVTEEVIIEVPGWQDFNSSYKKGINGLSIGLGATLKILIISFEGTAEYTFLRVPSGNGLVKKNEVNIGGWIFSAGAGISIGK